MMLTGFGDFTWAADGFWCALPTKIPIVSTQQTMIARAGNAPAYGAVFLTERVIPVVFGYTGALSPEDAWTLLFTRLRPTDPTPRELRGLRNDDVTEVAITAVLSIPPGQSASGEVNTFEAQFLSTDLFWRAASDTTVSKTLARGIDQASLVTITGYGKTPVSYRVQPTTARTAGGTDLGATRRQKWRVTNNGTEPMVNFPLHLTINTAALVTATTMQADGDDLRVWRDGVEISRTLTGPNTTTTKVWIVVPFLRNGEYQDYEIVYGNATATTPPTLTAGVDLPAFDLATSANGSWVYKTDDVVASAGLGLWYLDTGIAPPSEIRHGVPGAWQRAVTLFNSGNADDVSQFDFTEYVATGTKYRATFDAERGRKGGRQPSDNRQADGVAIHIPFGITKINVGFSILNERVLGTASSAIGKLVVLSRPNGQADRWSKILDYTTVQTTAIAIVAADYTAATNAKEMACAVWPFNEQQVNKNARGDRRIAASFNTDLTVTWPTANLAIALTEAEQTVYELAETLTVYEQSGRRVAYRSLKLGGDRTRRLAVELNQQILIDGAARRAWLLDSTNAVLSAVSPNAIKAYQTIIGANGALSEVAGDDWPALYPVTNPLPNYQFLTDATGWSKVEVDADMTVSALAVVGGMLRTAITASTAAVNDTLAVRADQVIGIQGRQYIAVGFDVVTSNVNLRATPRVWFFSDALGAVALSAVDGTSYTPVASVTSRRVDGFAVPADALSYRVGLKITSVTASQIGNVDVDQVYPNGPEVRLVDAGSPGSVDVDVLFRSLYP